MIRDLGAGEVVRDGKGLAAAGGADVILSTSNSIKAMVDGIQGLWPDGRLVTMGADAEPISVSLIDLISKRIRIIGSQQNGPEYLYEALDFVAQGNIRTRAGAHPVSLWDRGTVERSPHVATRRFGFQETHGLAMTCKTTESYGKNANRAQTERSFKRLSQRSTGHLR
jgi:hypothetical protein